MKISNLMNIYQDFAILTIKYQTITAANTDNKGHLFVTFFANYSCTQDRFVMPVPRPRQCFLKTLYTLTCDLLSIKLVPRHSYNSTKFVPGREKMRPRLRFASSGHGMLRSFRLVPGLFPDLDFLLQPPFTQQHKRPLLPCR